MSKYYVGLMSGTSIDAIDAVIVDLSQNSLKSTPLIIQTHSHPYPHDIHDDILSLCQPGENEIERLGQLDMQVGHVFANATRTLLTKANLAASDIIAIGSHGQTVRHQPNVDNPFSIQIGNPTVIARQTGITTVADFRNADIAAGGQGAPLVPAFHNQLFGSSGINRVVLNIGGIANITTLSANPQHPVTGFDTGPGNILMDAWTQEYFDQAFDDDGELSHRGTANATLLEALLSDPYFTSTPPKSTGREYFNMNWLTDYLEKLNGTFEPIDVLSTLNQLTVTTIATEIKKYAPDTTELLVCGGGVKNKTLMNKLAIELNNCNVVTTEKYNLDPDWVEAVAFAWLAKMALDNAPGNIPTVTGAKHEVILGGIYKA
ncbi:MAG: anhydro-N-acetylmuramic acid kinase [Gammaproteobacteria bacterium]|nr:anhydro-N-acetylmuramic acid kinase [Gammaproteobacteria bacterium]